MQIPIVVKHLPRLPSLISFDCMHKKMGGGGGGGGLAVQ